VFSNSDDEYCDPLWDRFNWEKFALLVCKDCLARAKLGWTAAREQMWAELPEMMGFAEWEDLEEALAVSVK